ncbi:hypothetical protein DF164_31360 [Burkholderia stagnalis]|nr:hypothetical protein DF164_31360 [Burkholderia stagnalis]RQY62454.1 hypothetical protein DF110_35705 [Burkholderia stagnalis]
MTTTTAVLLVVTASHAEAKTSDDVADSAELGKTVGEGLEKATGLPSNMIEQWVGGLFGRVLAQQIVDHDGKHHDLAGCASAGAFLAKDLLGQPEKSSDLARAGVDVAPMLLEGYAKTKRQICQTATIAKDLGYAGQDRDIAESCSVDAYLRQHLDETKLERVVALATKDFAKAYTCGG